jgi:hypothetical protein
MEPPAKAEDRDKGPSDTVGEGKSVLTGAEKTNKSADVGKVSLSSYNSSDDDGGSDGDNDDGEGDDDNDDGDDDVDDDDDDDGVDDDIDDVDSDEGDCDNIHGAIRGVGVTDPESMGLQPSLPATVFIERSQCGIAITASDSPDNMTARGELCEVLDDMIADKLELALHGHEAGAASSERTVNPHVNVPGRGMVSKHTLVLELNRRKSVGKNGDALGKLDTSRLRRVQQASKDGGDKANRETVDSLVSPRMIDG